MVIYNDSIHGSIQLNQLENAIVNTPEFYRLREIKQLGMLIKLHVGKHNVEAIHIINIP